MFITVSIEKLISFKSIRGVRRPRRGRFPLWCNAPFQGLSEGSGTRSPKNVIHGLLSAFIVHLIKNNFLLIFRSCIHLK